MQSTDRWHRGAIRCQGPGCDQYSVVGISAQLSTAGGRKDRTQVRATTVRLCDSCLDRLADGKMPKQLAASIADAVKKVRAAQ